MADRALVRTAVLTTAAVVAFPWNYDNQGVFGAVVITEVHTDDRSAVAR
ncbi:hypothetical protein [Streptomyces sp. CBMA29]|nr:hypothetical protein [Streptomyces sp. CBMA29]